MQMQYKSMQLIEEETEEVRSYVEDERTSEVKSIRSRNQTWQINNGGEREISFKDEFMRAESKGENSGFNF
mgnify:CR=1 FL=1